MGMPYHLPDLRAAAQMIAEDKLMETAYNSRAGPGTPFDIGYSHRQFTGRVAGSINN